MGNLKLVCFCGLVMGRLQNEILILNELSSMEIGNNY